MNFKTILASLVLSLALALPAFAAGQVDINSADAKTLAEGLNGVGLSNANSDWECLPALRFKPYCKQQVAVAAVSDSDSQVGVSKQLVNTPSPAPGSTKRHGLPQPIAH
jgi:hypothetical protein